MFLVQVFFAPRKTLLQLLDYTMKHFVFMCERCITTRQPIDQATKTAAATRSGDGGSYKILRRRLLDPATNTAEFGC